jgi:lipopolysaccharide biosynthesis glycosyltransferase|tara:strand:+ start:4068 stop:4883 length:816 start_codon:yes stop_codon:yes gene_type:complete
MILPVGSIVTEKTLEEFYILKKSLESFHDCRWILSCDAYTYDELNGQENVDCHLLVSTDDCDHNLADEEKRENWMKVMMTKFDIAKFGIEKYEHILFLDCDMIFVNPIEDKVLKQFENKDIDACICQHMTNDWKNEAMHGLFNAGMFHVKSLEFVEAWENLSKQYKQYGFYYEQQPLEYVQRNFLTVNLPINYNIGWWRFNNAQTHARLSLLQLQDNKLFFGPRPAVNFHVHTVRPLEYENFGQFLVDKVLTLFDKSQNDVYEKIALSIRK